METHTSNPVLQFILALMEQDKTRLEQVLSDSGKFEVMNYQFEIVTVNEFLFMDWILEKLHTTPIIKYQLEHDAQHPQHTVVLLNDGLFPAIHTELTDPYLTGFGIIHDGHRIDQIYFCYEFSNTPNFTIAEKMELDVQKLILSGIDEATARRNIFGTL